MPQLANGCQDMPMVEIHEDKQFPGFRKTPEQGHCLLLMEAEKGQRTFSDYPNILSCILSIQEMYEQHRLALGQDKDQYTIDNLWKWIFESFHRMEVFIYDKEIARYKRNTRNELKIIFIEQIQKVVNESASQQAAPIRGSTGSTPDEDEDEDGEDWDM